MSVCVCQQIRSRIDRFDWPAEISPVLFLKWKTSHQPLLAGPDWRELDIYSRPISDRRPNDETSHTSRRPSTIIDWSIPILSYDFLSTHLTSNLNQNQLNQIHLNFYWTAKKDLPGDIELRTRVIEPCRPSTCRPPSFIFLLSKVAPSAGKSWTVSRPAKSKSSNIQRETTGPAKEEIKELFLLQRSFPLSVCLFWFALSNRPLLLVRLSGTRV